MSKIELRKNTNQTVNGFKYTVRWICLFGKVGIGFCDRLFDDCDGIGKYLYAGFVVQSWTFRILWLIISIKREVRP